MRNVITQVVERHLLQGLYSIFSSLKITRMKNETVMAIAAENESVRNKRLDLKTKKVAIEEARDICASLAMRKELRTVSPAPLRCHAFRRMLMMHCNSTRMMNQIMRKRAPVRRTGVHP